MTDAPLVEDHWDLRPDRSAVLWLDGKPYRLRPPKMGEFRRIKDDITAGHETIAKAMGALSDRRTELAEQVGAKALTFADAQEELSRRSEELNAMTKDLHWETLRDVVALLCPTPLPAEDDLPTWLVRDADGSLGQLARWWQQCPPPHGRPESPAGE